MDIRKGDLVRILDGSKIPRVYIDWPPVLEDVVGEVCEVQSVDGSDSTVLIVVDETRRWVSSNWVRKVEQFERGDKVRIIDGSKIPVPDNEWTEYEARRVGQTGEIAGGRYDSGRYEVRFEDLLWNMYPAEWLEKVAEEMEVEKENEKPEFRIGDKVRILDGSKIPCDGLTWSNCHKWSVGVIGKIHWPYPSDNTYNVEFDGNNKLVFAADWLEKIVIGKGDHVKVIDGSKIPNDVHSWEGGGFKELVGKVGEARRRYHDGDFAVYFSNGKSRCIPSSWLEKVEEKESEKMKFKEGDEVEVFIPEGWTQSKFVTNLDDWVGKVGEIAKCDYRDDTYYVFCSSNSPKWFEAPCLRKVTKSKNVESNEPDKEGDPIMSKIVNGAKRSAKNIKKAAKRGVDQAISRTAADIVVDQAKKVLGDRWPEMFDEPVAQPVVTFAFTALANFGLEVMSEEIPKSQFALERTEAAMTDCASDAFKGGIQFIKPFLVGVSKELSEGEKVKDEEDE